MRDRWEFRCYLVSDGRTALDEWLESQPVSAEAKLDQRMRHLQQQPRDKWNRPSFDTLDDDCAGLGELRMVLKNVQYRVIGFASGEMEYTWLMVAKEVGGKFVPRNTCEIAQRRRAEVVKDRSKADACDFD